MHKFIPVLILTVLISFFTGISFSNEPLSPFGVMGYPYSHAYQGNWDNYWEKAQDYIKLWKTTGAKWDRRDFWWSVCEPEQGVWEWDYFDKVMKEFRDNDVNPLIILCYGSSWYGNAPVTDEEREAYGRYVFNMVNRYKDTCKHWEIWNEPDILPFWAPKPSGADYTALLKVAYTQAKKADPDCKVVAGALATDGRRFLNEMYENGAKDYFDILSFHTYGNNPTEESLTDIVEKLSKIMVTHGDMKPLWCTETGIYTGPAGVSEEEQASRGVKFTVTLLSLGVEKVFQLALKDWTESTDTVDATSFRGMYKYNNEPKKFFHAFKTMTELITGKYYLGQADVLKGARGHIFGDGRDNTLILWALDDPIEEELDLGVKKITIYKTDGTSSEMESRDGKYSIAVNSDPIFIQGVGAKTVLIANINVSPESRKIRTEESTSFSVMIRNPLSQIMEGSVYLITPNGFTLQGVGKKGRIPPGKLGKITFNIKADETVPLGKNTLTVVFNTSNASLRKVIAHKEIEITRPFDIEIIHPTSLKMPEDNFEIKLTNYLNKKLVGKIEIESNAPLAEKIREIALEAGKEETFRFKFISSEIVQGKEYDFKAIFSDGKITVDNSYSKKYIFVPYIDRDIEIDGDLSDWDGIKENIEPEMMTEVDFNPGLNMGLEDMQVKGRLAYNERYLYLALTVHDDAIALPDNVTIWDYDCLQLAIDGLNDALEGEGFDHKNDFEFNIALMRNGETYIAASEYPAGRIEEVVREAQVAARQSEPSTITYELALPAGILLPMNLQPENVFGFNFIINDNDNSGREGWFELAPGIGWGKQPWHYYQAVLLAK